MKRKIKFRGLRKDGKGWVYGVPFYISGERKCFIIDNCQSAHLTQEDSVFDGKEVKYRSVGQFTGLLDKNGTEIYEGDIVECWDDSADDSDWGLDRRHTGDIEYASPSFSLAVKTIFPNSISRTASRHEIDGSYQNMKTYLDRWVNAENIEVVGNIHEKKKTSKE